MQLTDMKDLTITSVVLAFVSLQGCAHLDKIAPRTIGVKDQVTLTSVEIKRSPIDESFTGSDLLVAVGTKIIGFITDKAAAVLENQGKQFASTYKAKQILDDGGSAASADGAYLVDRTYTFTRTVEFEDGKKQVAVQLIFDIERSKSGQSIRFVPKSLIYKASKARKLDSKFKDLSKMNLVISCTLRSSGRAIMGDQRTDTVGFTFYEEDVLKFDEVNILENASDWMPAPLSSAYSVEVSVSETSKPKEWLDYLAKKVREVGEAEAKKLLQ